jgi:hypothetical protein
MRKAPATRGIQPALLDEERADGILVADAADGFRQQLSYRQLPDFLACARIVAQRD